jgi:PKD repeat protein
VYNVKKIVPIIFGILILTSSSGFQFGPMSVQTAEAVPSKRIVGYFPWWESGDINSIDYSKVTDIIYFHIWPNADGSLDTTDINYDISNLHTIRDRAHAAGLDGIDIDWEPIDTEAKKDNFVLLLSDLSDALLPDGKLVTVAVNAERVELRASAVNSLSWINIMAYDMNWNNAEHSTFSDVVAALDRYEAIGVPKEKLVLGIPFYGRSSEWSSEMKYEDIVSTCTPSSNQNYCNGHYFNGIDLVQQKAQYVLDNGYDGVMVWNLGQDTYDQTSLLNAINTILDSTPLPDMPPIANDDIYFVESQGVWSVTSPGVLSNDNDPNGDQLTTVLVSDISNGNLIFNDDGSFSYSPNVNFEGIDLFTYHANDGVNDSNTATVTITVNAINDEVNVESFEVTTSGNKRWTGYVTTTVYSIDGPISNANIQALWSGGSSGTSNCTTNANGQCQVSQKTRGDSLTFTIDDIAGNGVTYNPSSSDSITFDKNGNILGGNNAPQVNAGGPYSGTEGISINFDGSGSSDTDGTIVNYDWDFGDGNTGTDQSPSHTFTSAGTFNVILTVTDDDEATDTDSTSVTVNPSNPSNNPPTADAGTDQNVTEGDDVTLDGSDSSDVDGDSLTYTWSQVNNGAPTVTLSDATAEQPTFTAPGVGAGGETLTFSLIVTDDEGESSLGDRVNISVADVPVSNDSIHVEALSGDLVDASGPWSNAIVTITVHGSNENPISGVLVSTSVSGDVSGSPSCTTDQTGNCDVIKKIKKGDAIFTVSDLSLTGSTYDSAANHLTSITVSVP